MTNKKTIFAVDDEKAMQHIYAEMFGEDFEVLCYGNPKEVLHKANEIKPDLAIIDIGLRGMDGYELCDALKQKEGLKDVPVIFVTGRDFSEDRGRAFYSGGTEYVTKPIRAASLMKLVQKLI